MGSSFGLPTLEVGESGLVLAHFAVKRGQFENFVKEISEAAVKLQSVSSNVAWVLGESDILLQIGLKDFRVVRKLQTSLSLFGLPGSTWIYSIPYTSLLGSLSLGKSGKSCYVVYLRVNRSLYAALGAQAERYVHARIERLLRSFEDINGVLHVCLGSPDLALVGSFSCSMQVWLSFIGAIRALTMPESPVELFTASFSLVGFPWDERSAGIVTENLTEPSPVPAILAKVSPTFLGKLENAKGVIESLLVGSEVSSYYFLEGRYDLLIFLKPQQGPLDLYNTLETLKALGASKTETHFLVSSVDSITEGLAKAREESAVEIWVTSDLKLGSCSCAQDARALDVPSSMLDLLPSGLQVDVQTVLALMRSSLTEATNCCDAKRAVKATRNGLLILLTLLERCQRRMKETLARQRKKGPSLSYSHVRLYEQAITRWCTYSERVLRERAADSVDDLFRERKTLPETRGSLRKLLFLADHLLEEFYSGFSPGIKADILEMEPLFATVYEPIGTIMSERSSGIVRIPSRYAFPLHLVLPQLWHEVGQFVFQNRYGHPFSAVTAEILEKLEQANKGRAKNAKRGSKVATIDAGKFLFEAADLYSDLIVLHYGFHDDYELFSRYLVTLFFETWLYEKYPLSEQRIGLEFLVKRLYLSAHFHRLLQVLWKQKRGALECKQELAEASGDFRARSDNLYALVDQIGIIHNAPRYQTEQARRALLTGVSVRERKQIAERALGSLRAGIYSYLEGYLLVLLVDLGISSEYIPDQAFSKVWSDVQRGLVVELDSVRANDLYLRLYRDDLERLLHTAHGDSPEPNFRTMAALGRSCTLSFYQKRS